jgi:hypothetical protein
MPRAWRAIPAATLIWCRRIVAAPGGGVAAADERAADRPVGMVISAWNRCDSYAGTNEHASHRRRAPGPQHGDLNRSGVAGAQTD